MAKDSNQSREFSEQEGLNHIYGLVLENQTIRKKQQNTKRIATFVVLIIFLFYVLMGYSFFVRFDLEAVKIQLGGDVPLVLLPELRKLGDSSGTEVFPVFAEEFMLKMQVDKEKFENEAMQLFLNLEQFVNNELSQRLSERLMELLEKNFKEFIDVYPELRIPKTF